MEEDCLILLAAGLIKSIISVCEKLSEKLKLLPLSKITAVLDISM